jgi:hypothetical protein
MKGTALWRYEKRVNESIEDLERILLDVSEGKFSYAYPFILSGTGTGVLKKEKGEFIAQYDDGHRSYILINKDAHSIAVRGEWWYCGVYTLKTESNVETTIIYEVFNVAKSLRWMVPLVTVNMKGDKEQFNQFVAGLLQRMQSTKDRLT